MNNALLQAVTVLLLLSLPRLHAQSASTERELVENGSFEQWAPAAALPDGWNSGKGWFDQGSGTYEISRDPRTVHHGRQALRIAGNNNRGLLCQTISLPAAEQSAVYLLSGWVKTDRLQGAASIGLDFKASDGKWLSGVNAVSAGGTSDWTFLTRPVEFPAHAASVVLSVRADQPNTGSVWFDAISLRQVAKPTENLPPPKISSSTRPVVRPLALPAWLNAPDVVTEQWGDIQASLKIPVRRLKTHELLEIHLALSRNRKPAHNLNATLRLNGRSVPLEATREDYVAWVSAATPGTVRLQLHLSDDSGTFREASSEIPLEIVASAEQIPPFFPIGIFWDALLPNSQAGIPDRADQKEMDAYVDRSFAAFRAHGLNAVWPGVPCDNMWNFVRNHRMKSMFRAAPGHEEIVQGTDAIEFNIPAPQLRISRINHPPTIDGKLDEALWQTIAPLSDFVLLNLTGIAREKTSVRLAYDNDNLYIALRCDESAMAEISRNFTRRDDPVWRDDAIELFLRPGLGKEFYQMVVNSIGAQLDVRWENGKADESWNAAGWRVASSASADHWVVEMAIPFQSLNRPAPQTGERWAFNVAREAHVHAENSSWSPAYHNFINPQMFGSLIFSGAENPAPVATASIQGKVVDAMRQPVSSAIVTAGSRVALTGKDGTFAFNAVESPGVLTAGSVSHEPQSLKPGREPLLFTLQDAVHLTLSPSQVVRQVKERVGQVPEELILGYYMADEPPITAADNLALVDRVYRHFAPRTPALSCYLGQNAIPVLCRKVDPPILLIDVYPLTVDSAPGDFRMRGFHAPAMEMAEYLDLARNSAPDKPLWVVVQTFSNTFDGKPFFRMPSPAEARAMVFLSIAHGAKGIIYFLYESKSADSPSGEGLRGLRGPDGSSTPVWQELTSINAKLNQWAPLLLTLDMTANIATATGNSDVQTFAGRNGSRYLIVVNKDVSRKCRIELAIDGLFEQIVTYPDKRQMPLRRNDGKSYVELQLEPGDGQLLQLLSDTAK